MEKDNKKVISDEEIEKLLKLSLISGKKEELGKDLNSILSYIKELEKTPTDDVNLDPKTDFTHQLRKDSPWPQETDKRDFLINSFREVEKDKLKVPPILNK